MNHTGKRHTDGSLARRGLRSALQRDTSTFARRWPGKLLVGAVLIAIPAAFLLRSVIGGTHIDDSWMAVLAALVLAVGYFLSRRLILTVLIGALVLGVVATGLTPRLSTVRNGDDGVLSRLDTEGVSGALTGYRDLTVAAIDLDAAVPVRFAGFGADQTTRMEIGSLTKAMTGLVIADAVERGELRMDIPVSTYLPQLAGSSAGTVTMQELVTHTAGYVPFGPATVVRGFWAAPLGRNFFPTEISQLMDEAREGTLTTRGSYAYSTLGTATAGLAVAAATGMSYPDLMRTRLFQPLGMTSTAVENERNAVDGGWSASGLPVEPWILGSYAPGGGVVSTANDLATFATALLDSTAPGLDAMDPAVLPGTGDTSVGMFWHVSERSTGQTITWHDGQTGGYTSYLGLDRDQRTAIIILSDVSNSAVTALGEDLLGALFVAGQELRREQPR